MKHFLSITLACAFVAQTASAKDPHNQISDFAGRKQIIVKWQDEAKAPALDASTKPTKKGATFADKKTQGVNALLKSNVTRKRLDVLYVGHLSLWVVDNNGVSEVNLPYLGATNIEWTDSDGLTYQIKEYPFDNNHAPIEGVVLKGDKFAGKFILKSVKERAIPASGRWIGQLGFPGGALLDVDLQIADRGMSAGNGCKSLPAQIGFPGQADQESYVTVCKTKTGAVYNGNVFYTDERYDDRYYISFTTEYTKFKDGSEAFQGSSWILSLAGGGSSEGKIYTSRPARFELP